MNSRVLEELRVSGVGGPVEKVGGGCSLQPGEGELSYSALGSKKRRANRGYHCWEKMSPRAISGWSLGPWAPAPGIRSIIPETAQPPMREAVSHRASLGCSGVQGSEPGSGEECECWCRYLQTLQWAGPPCLPLQGADHKQSGASKEMRRGLNGNGVAGHWELALGVSGRANRQRWRV